MNASLWSAVLAVLLSGTSQGQTTKQADTGMSKAYARLEETRAKIDRVGATPNDIAELKSERLWFISRGDDGADFVIGKLTAMNKAEVASVGLDQLVVANSTMKCELFRVLAETYRSVSPPVQQHILRALIESATPGVFADPHGMGGILSWAFAYIGKDSVNELLIAASTAPEDTRCHIDALLNTLRTLMKLPINARSAGLPPMLECGEEKPYRFQQIRRWTEWWQITAVRL